MGSRARAVKPYGETVARSAWRVRLFIEKPVETFMGIRELDVDWLSRCRPISGV
jgi:hypothetical protein